MTGKKLLAQWVESWLSEAKDRTRQGAAELFGTTRVSLYQWTDEKRTVRPDEVGRRVVERVTGGAVPADSWLTNEERERVAAAVPAPVESGLGNEPDEDAA